MPLQWHVDTSRSGSGSSRSKSSSSMVVCERGLRVREAINRLSVCIRVCVCAKHIGSMKSVGTTAVGVVVVVVVVVVAEVCACMKKCKVFVCVCVCVCVCVRVSHLNPICLIMHAFTRATATAKATTRNNWTRSCRVRRGGGGEREKQRRQTEILGDQKVPEPSHRPTNTIPIRSIRTFSYPMNEKKERERKTPSAGY
ncbi:hypothetical protein IWX47DRAFT_672725 [Phyllosticta citricarpa]